MWNRQEGSLVDSRFYGILDTGYVSPEHWIEKCRQLLDGGADIIQLRAKKESIPQKIKLLEAILPLFKNSRTPLIINDDLDLAIHYPVAGLHIGQDDTPVYRAREKLGPEKILGLSTHSLAQAEQALEDFSENLDYFAVGPVFPTRTKPDYRSVGLKLVEQVSLLLNKSIKTQPLPFFCIGGITRRNIKRVIDVGADRVVVVSDVLLSQDSGAAIREIMEVFQSKGHSILPTDES